MSSSSVVSKRVPVLVENNGTYARLQEYSEATGVSVTHAVNEALNDWMDTVGAARLEAFKKPGKDILRAKLLTMPAQQADKG